MHRCIIVLAIIALNIIGVIILSLVRFSGDFDTIGTREIKPYATAPPFEAPPKRVLTFAGSFTEE